MNTINDFELQCSQVPVSSDLACKLIEFWESSFKSSFDWLSEVLLGAEADNNEDIIYIVYKDNKIAATCRLTISRLDARLGLIGEVATSTEYRGKGLARKLCNQALSDFRSKNGEALFLGTGNPVAAGLYADMGWRQLTGSNVMLNTESDGKPEDFLTNYFESGRDMDVKIQQGCSRYRIPTIPLIVTPHNFHVLDANTRLLSTKYINQPSCEGLYLKYADIMNGGAWFVAERTDGVVIGISSAKETESGSYCIDAFTHPDYDEKYLGPLYAKAIQWATEHNASSVYTACSKSDSAKRGALHRLSSMISLSLRDIE